MDASTRLYARLGEIPEDPNDPESLAELLVCAFGAFERYYVCWKTQSGEYRQDGYDLPPALKDWLYPSDGSTRDFATLQVVFGRGEEYFASDKDGKLEFKEPEPTKPAEAEGKFEKAALRRSRTVSFLRPLSEISTKSDISAATDGAESNRSSTTSSRRLSRPPSLSYSRTNSDASLSLHQIDEPSTLPSSKPPKPSLISQWTTLGTNTDSSSPPPTTKPSSQQLDLNHLPAFTPPEGYMLVPISTSTSTPKPTYTSTATQTTPPPSPPLRIDTTTTSSSHTHSFSATSHDSLPHSPYLDAHPSIAADNPISMGRMLGYFNKPTYQLGDSLASGYGYSYGYGDAWGGGHMVVYEGGFGEG